MCIAHFSVFLAIFQDLHCVFLILQVFQCFLPYSRSYHVSLSFSYLVHFFFAIYQVLQCLCPIFYVFQFSCHNPGPRVCISHFPRFLVFLAIFQVKKCLCLIFHIFSVFLPYSTSCNVHLSLFQVFQCFSPSSRS